MYFISATPPPKLRWLRTRAIRQPRVHLLPAPSLLFRKTEFVALLRKRPELALRMIGSMSRHLRNVVGLLDDLTLKNAETRCLNWLLRHCPTPRSSHPCEIELESPKRIVAAELNITSANVLAHAAQVSRQATHSNNLKRHPRARSATNRADDATTAGRGGRISCQIASLLPAPARRFRALAAAQKIRNEPVRLERPI